MLKKIDYYIIKKFLGTYIFAIILIISIAVVFDINEKLDSFMQAPLKAIVFDYYLNFIPYFINLFSQLFTFIAVIFFTSKLADNSEIIAMLSSGISFKRLMVPYMISAAIIAGVTFLLNSYVIPPASVTRIEFLNKYVDNKKVDYASNVQLQVSPGVIAYINRYDDRTKTGYRFSMEKFEGKTLRSKLTAESVRYDSAYHWIIRNYTIRDFNGLREEFRQGKVIDSIITIEPSDFLISRYDAELMNTTQLREYIKRQKERGASNVKPFEIEYETRFASTIAAFILTSIGMSLSSRKVKGGMGMNIGIGLILSFSYILFSTISSSFAVSGSMSPRLAVWIPNIIYIIIAIYLYTKAPK
ncbi:MAG: LptF/LptG family permease [Bacteroidetes bacterium]|uniref:LptF/LptG family permease n=1 Tax=Candidatus Caccoplasma merdipullorum TaxID=2840718 RepID=A0A9D9E3Z6_9BACT|nr:LptF/LptG family permease [Candidatus Caccoplasma merdipullorum]